MPRANTRWTASTSRSKGISSSEPRTAAWPWWASCTAKATANPLAAKVLAALEKEGHGELSKADISVLLPKDKAYYHYLGSLTTPPLTENVEWYVLQAPVSLSPAQISQFRARYAHNNRKLQELNGRPLIRFPSVSLTANRAAPASR